MGVKRKYWRSEDNLKSYKYKVYKTFDDDQENYLTIARIDPEDYKCYEYEIPKAFINKKSTSKFGTTLYIFRKDKSKFLKIIDEGQRKDYRGYNTISDKA